MSINSEASVLACELRKYTHEQLVQKLAVMAIYMHRIAAEGDVADDPADRADSALRNTGISEDLK